jgi:predicted cupin superfamily sugar epimerase
MHSTTAKTLIEQLALARHPEGGWFKETYRASDKLAHKPCPRGLTGDWSASTAIYLLEAGDISALHRIQSDEVWHMPAPHCACTASFQMARTRVETRRQSGCGRAVPGRGACGLLVWRRVGRRRLCPGGLHGGTRF